MLKEFFDDNFNPLELNVDRLIEMHKVAFNVELDEGNAQAALNVLVNPGLTPQCEMVPVDMLTNVANIGIEYIYELHKLCIIYPFVRNDFLEQYKIAEQHIVSFGMAYFVMAFIRFQMKRFLKLQHGTTFAQLLSNGCNANIDSTKLYKTPTLLQYCAYREMLDNDRTPKQDKHVVLFEQQTGENAHILIFHFVITLLTTTISSHNVYRVASITMNLTDDTDTIRKYDIHISDQVANYRTSQILQFADSHNEKETTGCLTYMCGDLAEFGIKL